MRLNSQEILEQQYAADEIAAHSNEIAKFTATNMVDGTAGQSQYLDGLHNKAYGMGVMGLPASHITIAEDTKMANDRAAGYASVNRQGELEAGKLQRITCLTYNYKTLHSHYCHYMEYIQ